MRPLTDATPDIRQDDFLDDPHASKYRDELARRPEAFVRLFALLNDPANEQRLIDAEMHELPALCGVVRFIEADPAIKPVLAEGRSGYRFRQTVGVALKLKMAKLGWRTTGRKGSVKGAKHFTKAEHYVAAPMTRDDPASRALAALDAVAAIGDDDEREVTGRELMDAMAATRSAEGRAF
ncbi:MAG: hypothetical protein GY698_17375 [Actinomycetia bacterium]|nr:hypothetical protein [Actinomycetes bacterium]